MRKNILLLVCLSILCGLILLAGCEGDQGNPGRIGDRGKPGDPGTDPEIGKPADRYFGVGLVNGNKRAVNGDTRVLMTFDSTQRATSDLVVAARVYNPPLIDGIDGEEPEWGEQKSRIRLSFMNDVDNLTDPEIYELVCRTAWDEYYIYQLYTWKERKVSVRTADGDSSIYDVTASDQPQELFFDARRKIVTAIDSISEPESPDTTFFQWVRSNFVSRDSFCFPLPSGKDTCVFFNEKFDTTLVWLAPQTAEDKLAVFWTDNDAGNWSELAFRELFNMSGSGGTIPAGTNVDAWIWGSATSNPVSSMDDWHMTSTGLIPDFGAAPFIDNYLLPDSVPRYQSFRDPNSKTQANLLVKIYPLWYYDAVSYSVSGWDPNRPVYLTGVITTIPSDSRADIYARATFDDSGGIWTLEIRRARRTYNGDDVVF